MIMREQDRHFLWSLFGAVGLILFWRGVWELPAELPFNDLPWISLFIGLCILTLTGLVFREFDPLGGLEKSLSRTFRHINNSHDKENYLLIYHHPELKKNVEINGSRLRAVEKEYLVFEDAKKKEFFIPFDHITEILHKGKLYWRY